MIVRPRTASKGGLRLRDDDNAKKHSGDNVCRYMSDMRLLSSFVLDRQTLSFYISCKEKGLFASKKILRIKADYENISPMAIKSHSGLQYHYIFPHPK
jgi:hypothetical protein